MSSMLAEEGDRRLEVDYHLHSTYHWHDLVAQIDAGSTGNVFQQRGSLL